ncbi:hypothetical protein [Pseudooceanicola nitratireducens]|uniref:hypothetical protein n=1 Tax=Pseudooceanicola nitratireducens TaxID=517719 RepID=UPI003C7A1F8A
MNVMASDFPETDFPQLTEAREIILDRHRFSLDQVLDAALIVSDFSTDPRECQMAKAMIDIHKRTVGFAYRDSISGLAIMGVLVTAIILLLNFG